MNNEGFENLKEIENLRERIADLENPSTEIIHKAVTIKAPVKKHVTHEDLDTLRVDIMKDFEDMYDRVFEKAFNKAFTKAYSNDK